MEKVREIVGKLWLHKEKVLLVVLIGVLIVQVWRGVREGTGDNSNVDLVKPRERDIPYSDLDDRAKDRIRNKFPEVTAVPYAPDPLALVPAAKLTKDNPFSIWRLNEEGEDQGKAKPNIVVKTIRLGMDGVPTVHLVINGARARYHEGEEKDGFRVEEIDEETRTVKVFSESHGKAFTYTGP